MMTQAPNSTWGPGELLKYEQDCAAREVRDVPGRVLLDVLLPARGFLPAPTLKAGQVMRVIDVEGQQGRSHPVRSQESEESVIDEQYRAY
jgi:uncharacterized protein YcgI (DUF1989 family)